MTYTTHLGCTVEATVYVNEAGVTVEAITLACPSTPLRVQPDYRPGVAMPWNRSKAKHTTP